MTSFRQMLAFASAWRMDNPLVDFGQTPYQPTEPVNLVVDNFASAGGLLRGLFEYNYRSTSLQLVPHIPDNVTLYAQPFSFRWGPYSIWLNTSGVRSSGIAAARLNCAALGPPHSFDSTSLTLDFSAMPPASKASLAALTSELSTARTQVTLEVLFRQRGSSPTAPSSTKAAPARPPPSAQPVVTHDCAALLAAHGLSEATSKRMSTFLAAIQSDDELKATLAYALASQAVAYADGFQARCTGLNTGSLPALRSPQAEEASLVQMLGASVSLEVGLESHLNHTVARSVEQPLAGRLLASWREAKIADATALI